MRIQNINKTLILYFKAWLLSWQSWATYDIDKLIVINKKLSDIEDQMKKQ